VPVVLPPKLGGCLKIGRQLARSLLLLSHARKSTLLPGHGPHSRSRRCEAEPLVAFPEL
jgi:hypothetical protein